MPKGLVDTYIDQLPDGWASFPECTAKASLLQGTAQTISDAVVRSLPVPLAARLLEDQPSTAWIPEMELVAIMLASYDAKLKSGAGKEPFLDEITQLNLQLYRQPQYRALVENRNPARLLRTISNRWHMFHRGTDVDLIENDDLSATLELRYPPALFPLALLEIRTATVRGAMLACDVAETHVQMQEREPGRTHYRLQWKL